LTNFTAIAIIINFSCIDRLKFYYNGSTLNTLINVTLLTVIILVVSCERASSIAHRKHIEELNTVNLKHNCVEYFLQSIYKFLIFNYNSYNNVDWLLLLTVIVKF